MALGRVAITAACGIAAFSLLLLIISVATPVWLDGGSGSSIGLFRKCYGDGGSNQGCVNENRNPNAGLAVFGLLLLAFSIIAGIASIFVEYEMVLYASLGLLYFASIFVMSAYSTWAVYSRDTNSVFFPTSSTPNSIGYSYNLCVACHYFLWTALSILAFGTGYRMGEGRSTAGG